MHRTDKFKIGITTTSFLLLNLSSPASSQIVSCEATAIAQANAEAPYTNIPYQNLYERYLQYCFDSNVNQNGTPGAPGGGTGCRAGVTCTINNPPSRIPTNPAG